MMALGVKLDHKFIVHMFFEALVFKHGLNCFVMVLGIPFKNYDGVVWNNLGMMEFQYFVGIAWPHLPLCFFLHLLKP